MTEPLVSIKMLTYNHAPFIAQAIEGVLQQRTTFPFELIIGEDYSADGTRKIVFEYQKKFPNIIRVITSDKNIGATRNSLRTVKACQGKYIAFCEGDDYWHHPYKLQKQVDYLENHLECGLVFTDYDIYFNSTREIARKVNQSKGYGLPMNLTIEQAIGPEGEVIRTCTIMVRRQLLEQVRERDPYLHQNEKLLMADLQLFAELTLMARVSYLPESLATYRILEESASRSRDPVKSGQFGKCSCEIKLYLCDKHKLSPNIRRVIESNWCEVSLRLAFHTRDKNLADQVRWRKSTFTWEEWLRYYGTKHSMFNPPLRLVALFCRVFKRKRIIDGFN